MPTSLNRLLYAHGAFICIIIALILWVFFGAWFQTNQQISQAQQTTLSIDYGYLLNSEHLRVDTIADEDFIKTELNHAPVVYGDVNQWFQLKFKNNTQLKQHLVLLIDNPMTDRIEIFQRRDNAAFEFIVEFGDTVDLVPRALRILPHVVFDLDTDEHLEFRIHAQTTGAPYLPLIILDNPTFKEYQNTLHLIWGTFIGIVLLMSAYNLVLYFGVGDRAYFVYICYIYTMLMLLGVVHGYGYYVFPESVQRWLSSKIIAIDSLAAYFTILFCVYFLRFNLRDGKFFLMAWYASITLLVFTGLSLILPEYTAAKFFALLQALTYILACWLIVDKIRSKFRWTKYYVISWVPFFIGAAIGFLLYSGKLDYNFINRHALMFSVMFEMAFISMALADRLGNTERERLFQATHDFKLGIANEALLENAIDRHATTSSSHELTLITVEISNYDAVIPYIPDHEIKKLMLKMGDDFVAQLEKSVVVLEIDQHRNSHSKFALMRGEMFSFLIRSEKLTDLETTLKQISNRDNFNPLQESIPYRIQCIFGAATLTSVTMQANDLINQAKQSINQASESGHIFYIYSPESHKDSDQKVRLAQDLGNAITDNALLLYHQPQINFQDNQYVSSEVLLRWQHPQLGEISPTIFIDIAEKTGLIKRLTRWVLNQAFIQTKKLLEQGHVSLNVSINISAHDLSREGFYEEIETLLKKHELPARFFTLEITETSHLTDMPFFVRNFNALRQSGFNFAIDDFGTGYSSLTYANDHPFTELKIDRSFVQDFLISKRQLAIVSATISMAKELKLRVTAEGVEDGKTMQALKVLGCDKIQGYYVAKPMPFEQYLTWQYSANENSDGIGENLPLPFNPEN